ncbi:MAG: phage tail protein [Myxococcota bacterium]|nr:phage tail protein [Myxococcota bacterium]
MKRWSWGARASVLGLAATCVMLLGAWLDRALADRPPGAPPLAYSGTALIGGAPIADGPHTIGVTVYTRATGPTGAVCFAAPAAVDTRAGRFSVTLTDPECGNAIQQGSELYVEVSVDGTTLSPRQRIGAVPYAIQAENGVPAGTIMAFGGVTPPPGWLICDGRALDGGEPQYARCGRRSERRGAPARTTPMQRPTSTSPICVVASCAASTPSKRPRRSATRTAQLAPPRRPAGSPARASARSRPTRRRGRPRRS